MANLVLNIDVSDDEFKTLCVENINNLPQDKLQEILLKAVEVALIRDRNNPYLDKDSNVLIREKSPYNGYTKIYEPTETLRGILKSIDTEAYFKPLADEIAAYIRDNYVDMVREYMVSAFASMLYTQTQKWDIEVMVNNRIKSELNKK